MIIIPNVYVKETLQQEQEFDWSLVDLSYLKDCFDKWEETQDEIATVRDELRLNRWLRKYVIEPYLRHDTTDEKR